MSETRRRIRDRIHTNAGIHFNELVRESAFAPGQIQYHVRRLVNDGVVVSEQLYGQTHYYPPAYDAWDRRTLALFRRETAREIIVALIERESVRPDDLAADLEIARSTLEWHLDRLCACEIVEKAYGDHNRVTLRLADPERTGNVLSTVTPSGPDRLVDRFTRLVDRLLERGE
ncbi:winged helix-turn-helix transcriptional regulator [Halobacteria archaeon AArc-m2/3/4]|uniref:Winged helix-turn-helix transcriptional regulator n=1 Tax=Natronoglomus mannanivorans TaxID=2979990 RepID=A0ABT2QIA0_9EURY|nr:winged helix-turn-helix transcriptional regulator [Halobacteria archaeon AArc-m2/3/4]